MSVLGKILAVLNVLGVCAFLFIGLLGYSKRQTWAYVNFRHDLAIKGIPVDEQEQDADGVKRVDRLHAQVLTELLGSTQVNTQAKEVTRVKDELDAKNRDAGSDTRKRMGAYDRILMPV